MWYRVLENKPTVSTERGFYLRVVEVPIITVNEPGALLQDIKKEHQAHFVGVFVIVDGCHKQTINFKNVPEFPSHAVGKPKGGICRLTSMGGY